MAAQVQKLSKRYSRTQALKIIKRNLKDGSVVFRLHAKKRKRSRNFTMGDIRHVLKNGRIETEPEPHIETGNWIYRVKGETLDGGPLEVVVSLENDKTIIITCIGR